MCRRERGIKAMARKKLGPAEIEISVKCSRCGSKLYEGPYERSVVSKLKKDIRSEGWADCPGVGTLCRDCAEKWENESF